MILIIIGLIIILLLIQIQQGQIIHETKIVPRFVYEPQVLESQLREQRDIRLDPRILSIQKQQNSFEVLGLVFSQGGSNDTLELLGRESIVQRQRFVYKVRDPITGLVINLNDSEPMNELYSGDTIDILGRQGLFTVNITKKNFIY
jgi:hypothetical protein